MTGTTSTTSIDETADQAAVMCVVERATTLQDDARALPDLHTPDAVVVNVAGRRIAGREVFRDAMSTALHSSLAQVRTSVEIDDVRFLTPDVAIVICTKTIHDARESRDPDESLPSVGMMSYVVTRTEGDGWLIALAQTTPSR